MQETLNHDWTESCALRKWVIRTKGGNIGYVNIQYAPTGLVRYFLSISTRHILNAPDVVLIANKANGEVVYIIKNDKFYNMKG